MNLTPKLTGAPDVSRLQRWNNLIPFVLRAALDVNGGPGVYTAWVMDEPWRGGPPTISRAKSQLARTTGIGVGEPLELEVLDEVTVSAA
jgi:hypothetical protein